MSSSTLPRIPLTAGDRLPEMICTDEDGVDHTGYTITLHVERPDDTVLIRTAVPIDLTQGRWKFTWDPGDLIAGLGQLAEIQRVTPGGLPLTSEKFLLDVEREIA